MFKQIFLQINDWSHRSFGLFAGLYFVLFGLSGSFLSFDDFFERWIYPQRIYANAAAERFDLPAIVSAAKAQVGAEKKPMRVILPDDPAANARLTFNMAAEGEPNDFVTVFVDPGTHATFGPYGKFGSVVSILVNFHHNLFLDAKTGRFWMGISGVLLLVMLVSGLVIWWPGKRFVKKQMKWPKIRGLYKGSIDLHKFAGLYTLLLMILVTFSGVYISVPQWFEGEAPKKEGKQEKPRNQVPPINFSELQALLGEQGILKRPLTVSYNLREKSIQVRGGEHGPSLIFDPDRKTLSEKAKDPKAGSFQMKRFQKEVHTGDYWGLFGKSISFFAGLLPLFFYVTGCYIWWKRRSIASQRGSLGSL